jgi:hypothetical protein
MDHTFITILTSSLDGSIATIINGNLEALLICARNYNNI